MNNLDYIHLDSKGNLYKSSSFELIKYSPNKSTDVDALLKSFSNNPYQVFFKTPFSFISYSFDNKIISSFKAHPTSFYPGSPFDVFNSVKSYIKERKLVIPRFYLYPSSNCNSRCTICQFNFRRKAPSYMKFEIIKKIIDYMSRQEPRPILLSSIISGDGEPTLHNDFNKIIEYYAENNVNIFLTSNCILPHNKNDMIIETVARNVSMLTISLKGLNSHAYHRYQGIDEKMKTFDRVINNIESLLKKLDKYKRRDKILIGIASLILPENTYLYRIMIDYFVSLKLDYVYLNVVEPSYERWSIYFTEKEIRDTLESLRSISTDYKNCGTLIRFPANPFKTRYNHSVYYDADIRKVKNTCGSALWNPIAIPGNNNNGVLLSCRNSENFNDENFWYSSDLYGEELSNVMDNSRIAKVMQATSSCHQCRLERQVNLFDKIIDTELSNNSRGSFMLTFDAGILSKQNGAITFEETL
ncbi:MAG: radical SAM protein [Nitrospirae bacterium]|nr:radical SAM protein [Nitrospirota bacterium]